MAEKGLIEKSTLTAIADAIRAKLESSNKMQPSEMAALIASISPGAKLAMGSVTVSSATTSYAINHGLGEIPNFGILYMSAIKVDNTQLCVVAKDNSGKGLNAIIYRVMGSVAVSNSSSYLSPTSFNVTKATFGAYYTDGSTRYNFKGTYNYIIGVI